MLFWMFEESEQSLWIPENIIHRSTACIQRLLYCVEYSILLHYFIPANNLLDRRFSMDNKIKMVHLLKDLHSRGWRCFLLTDTLDDYQNRLSSPLFNPEFEKQEFFYRLIRQLACAPVNASNTTALLRTLNDENICKLTRNNIIYFIATTAQYNAHRCKIPNNAGNKQQYSEYKKNMCRLLIGVSVDAVSGWLLLASFFYTRRRYNIALTIIAHVLSKCTPDIIFYSSFFEQPNTKYIDLKFKRIFKMLTSLTIGQIKFHKYSTLNPLNFNPR